MKHLATVMVMMALACSAFAGVTYKVQSSTTGVRNVTIAGNVAVEGSRLRMDVTSGDNMLFKDNSVVLSNDGGKTMSVLDPSTKNYYDLQIEQVLGSTAGMLRNLSDMVKVTFDNPQVNFRDGGNGGTVQGYPTRKFTVDAAYDMNIDAMGSKMTTHMTMSTESWTTDQLAAELSSFLQTRGLRTGVEGVDRLIEAQSGVRGFPLKQVSTVHVNQRGNDLTMVTTSTVTNIQKKTIDAAQFAMPAGYTKVDDPVTRMMNQLKQIK
ncbi:MAG TPA: DUF4412 domain-containing protein [Thermoanaerobaculia bacterium]